jgi:hypothetical protein
MLSTIIIICRGGKINLIYNVHKSDSDHVSCPPQHISEQHSMQPKHATAVQSCVKTIANWLFILKQHWTQHIQQHCLHIMLQQLEAALMIISAASGNFDSSAPGRRFSAVAVKLPKPTPRFLRNILLRPWESTFWGLTCHGNCLHEFWKTLTLRWYKSWIKIRWIRMKGTSSM